MSVCCECCVLSDRGLCDELITRPEESYRLWCVFVYDLENLVNEEAMARVGPQGQKKYTVVRRVRDLVLLVCPVYRCYFWYLLRRKLFLKCRAWQINVQVFKLFLNVLFSVSLQLDCSWY
jgi:hypothetical protein